MAKHPNPKHPIVLVFGEDDNDREAIIHLAQALNKNLPRMCKRRSPIVLIKDTKAASDRKNAADIANVTRADMAKYCVRAVIAHRDCDAVEPAHESIAERIEQELNNAGVPNPIAVAPAWEIEAWWYLWPQAVAQVNGKWAPLNRKGCVGMITNAKETLKRELRPKSKTVTTRDYSESDGPEIARFAKELGIVDQPVAISDSFNEFKKRIVKLKC